MRLDTVLKQLEAGTLSLDAAVAAVRSMKLPPAHPPLTTAQLLEKPDPRPPRRGSFFAVSAAYSEGRISAQEYTALAEAAADAGGRGDSGGNPAAASPAGDTDVAGGQGSPERSRPEDSAGSSK